MPDPQPVDAGPVELVFYGGRYMADDVREQVCDWIRANGLDPERISDDAAIAVRGTTLTVEEVGDQLEAVDGHLVRTVPLLALPPDGLLMDARTAVGVMRARLRLAVAQRDEAQAALSKVLGDLVGAVETLAGLKVAPEVDRG